MTSPIKIIARIITKLSIVFSSVVIKSISVIDKKTAKKNEIKLFSTKKFPDL
jgi:ribosomal protein L20A (L18A)